MSFKKIALTLIKIIGLSLSIWLFIALLWITTEGEYNPPSPQKLFFYTTSFSIIIYLWKKYVENNFDKIQNYLEKF